MKPQSKKTKTMYRVDDYNKFGMGDLIGFFPTLKDAKGVLCASQREIKKMPESVAHSHITKFRCLVSIEDNLEAWGHDESEILKDYYFI
jgi:hypothetical protein